MLTDTEELADGRIGRFPASCQRQQAVGRPLLTVGLWQDSGGNAPVTCRSIEIRFEGRLTDPTNADYRPKAEVSEIPKQPVKLLW